MHKLFKTLAVLATLAVNVFTQETAEEYNGVPLGELRNETMGLHADVYITNGSAVQLINFRINSGYDIKFFVTGGPDLNYADVVYNVEDSPGGEYMKEMSTPLSGRTKSKRLVVVVPRKLNQWKFFGIVAENGQDFMAAIKLNKRSPQPFCCIKMNGSDMAITNGEYGTSVGAVTVLDHKTIQITDFSIEGAKPPDAWFYFGLGDVNTETGKKGLIVGRDTKVRHCAMHENYNNSTITVELADGQTIYDVDYLSIFCYQYGVDFGSVHFRLSSHRMPVPVHLPPVSDGPLPELGPAIECPQYQPIEDPLRH